MGREGVIGEGIWTKGRELDGRRDDLERKERKSKWKMKGATVGDREEERVKSGRDGLFYFQMAWLSGDNTFTETSHRISHWLHLPALPCCSLVKPATDQ